MAEFKFDNFDKGSKNYKTLSNMLLMYTEISKIYKHFEGGEDFLNRISNSREFIYDMIIEFLELPKENIDYFTGEGLCHDYWLDTITDYIDGKISLEEAIRLMTENFDYKEVEEDVTNGDS